MKDKQIHRGASLLNRVSLLVSYRLKNNMLLKTDQTEPKQIIVLLERITNQTSIAVFGKIIYVMRLVPFNNTVFNEKLSITKIKKRY